MARIGWPLWPAMWWTVGALAMLGEDEIFRALVFGKESGLQDGRTYIVKERKPQRALERFTRLVSEGHRGLYITRQHPDHVSRSRLESVRLIWLSTTLGANYMDPHNLSSLTALVKDYLAASPKVVVLLDGLEYLMINNDFARILRFVEVLNELVSEQGAILILSVDDRAFEEKELALLERSAELIE